MFIACAWLFMLTKHTDCYRIFVSGNARSIGKKADYMGRHGKFLAVVVLMWFSQYVFIPYFTPYLMAIGIAGTTTGAILGTYGFSQTLLRIPFGVAANRSGNHRAFMLSGFVCLIVSGIILCLFTHPAAYFIARFLAGVSSATWVSFTVYYAGLFPENETGRAIAAIMMASNMGTLLSYIFGIFIFDVLGIGFMFAVSAVSAVAGLALLASIKSGAPGAGDAAGAEDSVGSFTPVNKAAAASTPDGSAVPAADGAVPADAAKPARGGMDLKAFAKVIGNRSLLLFSAIAALKQIITFATAMSFTSDFARNRFGAGGSELALLSMLYSFACIIGAYWVRTRLSERIPQKYQIAGAFALSALYCLIVPNSGAIWVLFIMQFIGGFGQAAAMTLTMALALGGVPQSGRSAAMGIYQCIYGIGMTLGPVMMGGFLDIFGRFDAACAVFAVICLGGLLLSATAIRRKSPA